MLARIDTGEDIETVTPSARMYPELAKVPWAVGDIGRRARLVIVR
jgi:hypothetical protein